MFDNVLTVSFEQLKTILTFAFTRCYYKVHSEMVFLGVSSNNFGVIGNIDDAKEVLNAIRPVAEDAQIAFFANRIEVYSNGEKFVFKALR